MKTNNHTTNQQADEEIRAIIAKELKRQQSKLLLIASENFASQEVIKTMGSVLTNKYAEGYPQKRYYGGCEYVDEAEQLAIDRGMELFGSEYINVQPHSGVNANTAVFLAILKPGDKILSMNLMDGGHLSHGQSHNLSGKYFDIYNYSLDPETELIDYDQVMETAQKVKPKLIICGASSYSRIIDFKKFRNIADQVGAYLMADIAHIAGLIVGGVHPTSVGLADFTTGTTHKTLRGPRGGMIISSQEYASMLNSAVFPGIQGGPLMHVIAAKAVCFREALSDSFKQYAQNIVNNCKTLCSHLQEEGFRIVSGGTDNHLFLVDLSDKGITGFDATGALGSCGIVINKNLIPYDKKSPVITSGIRIGTAAVTTQGMGPEQMHQIGDIISYILHNMDNQAKLAQAKKKVEDLISQFPIYQDF
ncbi:MAG: serine hydroxymethyltransferase [Actinomycetota bacterium]|nr:serine hydroxymethyltransferase [Actinomycetota bacterium]